MKASCFALLLLLSSSCGLRTFGCHKGVIGVDTAVAYMARIDPELTDNIDVFCDDEAALASITRCGRAQATHVESCLMWAGDGLYAARIYVSHEEDAAKAVCHELEHAKREVWETEDGCQSHEQSCNYDMAEVDACMAAVDAERESISPRR